MTDRLIELERRVESLEGTVRDLEQRLATLDPEPQPADTGFAGLPAPGRAAGIFSGVVALTGRSCLVLGGAFLIRAATEAGAVSRVAGAAAGIAYAGIWLFLADRDGRRRRVSSAAFHAVIAAGIAYPLLWETCARLGLLSPGGLVGAVAATTAILLALSLRQPAGALAWAATLGAISTLFALIVSTGAIAPAAGAMILLAGATIGLAEMRGWRGPRWLAAIGANVTVLAAMAGVGKNLSSGTAIALALALPTVCVAGLAVPTLARKRLIAPFDMVQISASLLLGFGAAISAARSARSGVAILGVAAAGAGLVAYFVAFGSAGRREGDQRSFHFWASLALLMMIAGGTFWLSGAALSFLWSALALGTSLLQARIHGETLRWHAVAYVGAASVVSGYFGFIAGSFAGPAAGVVENSSLPALCVLAAAVGSFSILTASRSEAVRSPGELPGFLIGTAALGGLAALGIRLLGVSAPMGGGPLAAVRTGVLAAASIAAALLGRRARTRELAWLVYPLLALGGIKLLFEDVPKGTPLTLFIGFALFGSALLLAPRIARSGPIAATSPD